MKNKINKTFWILKAQFCNIIIWYYLLTGNKNKAKEKFNDYNEKWMNVFVGSDN